MRDTTTVELVAWDGPWESNDPDANFKSEMALYASAQPMTTLTSLAAALDVPPGAIVHYVLAKWASAGSGAILEIGPTMIGRLWDPVARAEAEDTDTARLVSYHQLREMISWLRHPLVTDGPESGY
jgi:hypothetical protein